MNGSDPLKPKARCHLLPPNATALERSLSLSTTRIEAIPIEITKVWNPSGCPGEFLPWLAWGTSLDIWQDSWQEAVRRVAVWQSVEIHKCKGTRKAIADAIRWVLALTIEPDRKDMHDLEQQLDGMFSIREWWDRQAGEPRGEPLSFDVQLVLGQLLSSIGVLEGTLYKNLRRAIDSVKPLTSRYTLSVGGLEMESTIPIGPAARAVQMARFTVIPE